MRSDTKDDDEFIKKYEAFESKQQAKHPCRKAFHDEESFATILHLIRRREHIKDIEVKKLELRLGKRSNLSRDAALEKLLIEIECFKDILALHKLLRQDNDKLRNRGEAKKTCSCKPKRS